MEAVLQRGWWLPETKEDSLREGKNETKKRKSNVSIPCLIFIQTQALPLRPLPLPFLSSFIILPVSICPSITYSLSLFPLITASLFSSSASPTVSITVREKNTPKMVPPSGKYLQLEDKSLLKQVQGILLTQEFLVHSIGQRTRVFMLIFTHHRCRL